MNRPQREWIIKIPVRTGDKLNIYEINDYIKDLEGYCDELEKENKNYKDFSSWQSNFLRKIEHDSKSDIDMCIATNNKLLKENELLKKKYVASRRLIKVLKDKFKEEKKKVKEGRIE